MLARRAPLVRSTLAVLGGGVFATAVVTVAALVGAACGKAIGSEGGPCTGGGACDPGLVCLSDLCVDPNGGEGEGEGNEGEGEGGEGEGNEGEGEGNEGEGECQGDEPAANDRGDCGTIPASTCAPLDENAAVQTCDVAGAILRSGLFQAAFDCIAAIPTSACGQLQARVDACFGELTACPLADADRLCSDVFDQCVAEGDDGFPEGACAGDLRSTNQAFRTAYAECFNAAVGTPCSQVHDDCYNTALNTVVSGG